MEVYIEPTQDNQCAAYLEVQEAFGNAKLFTV